MKVDQIKTQAIITNGITSKVKSVTRATMAGELLAKASEIPNSKAMQTPVRAANRSAWAKLPRWSACSKKRLGFV